MAIEEGPVVQMDDCRVKRGYNTSISRGFMVLCRYAGCNLLNLGHHGRSKIG
jgi:hypothetical protein